MTGARRTAFSAVEADEIRALLADARHESLPRQRMARARLRRVGFLAADAPEPLPTTGGLDDMLATGAIVIDESLARARIEPQRAGYIYRVAVGVTGDPVDESWSAFDERYQWFGQAPQSVTSGAHLFILAVDRWRSAVVGLYETVARSADRLPGSPNVERWPWALGVRPLAAIPPPEALRVEGQRGPQSGLPERIYDESVWPELYDAISASPPPPAPTTLEQRVQELEPEDVAEDVLAAVAILGTRARQPEVIERAIELGAWTDGQLSARTWYTGTGTFSHVEQIVRMALRDEHVLRQRLVRRTGGSPFTFRDGADRPPSRFGVDYRPAAAGEPTAPDEAPHQFDLSALDAATARHMGLQDALATELRTRGIQPRSSGSWQPRFDLAFEHQGNHYVVEVKGGAPVSHQQVRLGVGQVLEYCQLLLRGGEEARPVLLFEGQPPEPWPGLLGEGLGIGVLSSERLRASLDQLLKPVER